MPDDMGHWMGMRWAGVVQQEKRAVLVDAGLQAHPGKTAPSLAASGLCRLALALA